MPSYASIYWYFSQFEDYIAQLLIKIWLMSWIYIRDICNLQNCASQENEFSKMK